MTNLQGYSLLLWVDPKSGRRNGSETILVPVPLADTLNAARRVLYDKRGRTSAWECAGVTRTFPTSEDNDDDDRVADLRPPPHRRVAAPG